MRRNGEYPSKLSGTQALFALRLAKRADGLALSLAQAEELKTIARPAAIPGHRPHRQLLGTRGQGEFKVQALSHLQIGRQQSGNPGLADAQGAPEKRAGLAAAEHLNAGIQGKPEEAAWFVGMGRAGLPAAFAGKRADFGHDLAGEWVTPAGCLPASSAVVAGSAPANHFTNCRTWSRYSLDISTNLMPMPRPA